MQAFKFPYSKQKKRKKLNWIKTFKTYMGDNSVL